MEDADVKYSLRSLKYLFKVHSIIVVLSLLVAKTNSTSKDVSVTYDHMYTSGLNAYVGGKWFQCSAFLEKAIQERKSYKTVIVDCRLRCRSNSVLSDFFIPADLNTSVDALRLNFFENLVKESHCLKTCKTEKLGYQISENRVLLEVEEDFDNLKPYSYLQFCYYKVNL
ncbi:prolyl 3-hydroxylase 2-like [Mytilus edulis]|uniref:prolyl 3-hydroxylase 2-like n=1 Tax=Mytilus edulis TaxID=6550 RepID=UPI0039F13EBA